MDYFEYTSPENAGVDSAEVTGFIKDVENMGICFHSFILLRHGKIFAEGYEKHFSKDYKHRLYSVSKTYTSAAIGCLIGEGKLSLDDKVYTFFPDKCPDNLHPYIKDTTVRHLLMMSTPFDETTYHPEDGDWVYTFFNTKPSHRPGSVFNYDTSGTLILCAIIERITGMDFTKYLYEKVLKYIGYDEAPECVREPAGVQWGGSGVLASSRELAAFALLFMNSGRNKDGVQLIPEDYVNEAIKPQICNLENNECSPFRGRGYGYKIWSTTRGFAFLGMGNQLAICFPEEDILLVCTSDDQGNDYAREYIFDYVESHIVNTCKEGKCEDGSPLLLDGMLHFALPVCPPVTPDFKANGFTYKMLENKYGFDDITFDISETEGTMTYYRFGKKKVLNFGINCFKDGYFPEDDYSGMTINKPEGQYKCAAAGIWAEKDKLILRIYIIDRYFGNTTMNISFKDGGLDFKMRSSAEWFLKEYRGYLSSENTL